MTQNDTSTDGIYHKLVDMEVELSFGIGLSLWVLSLQTEEVWIAVVGSAVFVAALWDSNRRSDDTDTDQ